MDKKILIISPIMLLIATQYKYLLFILVMFNVIDYVTGIAKSFSNDIKFKPLLAIKGIVKKLTALAYIAVALGLDVAVADYFKLEQPLLITGVVIMWLLGNEALSILSNIANTTNLKAPKPLLEILEKYFKEH